jgi:phosphate transport system substrate-binding protein
MRRYGYFLFLILWTVAACKGPLGFDFEDPDAVEDFEIAGLTLDNFPFIDCSTSTSPLRDMVMYTLLDIPYTWGLDIVSGSQYAIWYQLPEGMVQGSDEHRAFTNKLNSDLGRSSGSHGAYVNLIDGVSGVIIDSRDISRNESQYAREKGVTVKTKPLAWDALVFIVHPSNKVKSLTQEQIRKIYTGKITNWKQVGGEDHEIHPYTRDPDSGSQEKMETLVMGGQPMISLPEMQGYTMLSPYFSIESDEWGIGYTPYFFCERMVGDLRSVSVLAVDGVFPTPESILNGVQGKSGAYPYYSNIYAAIRADEPASSFPSQIYRWLSTPTAKDIVDKSGYISLRRH